MGTKLGRAAVLVAISCGVPGHLSAQTHQNAVIDLWAQGKPAFGVYAPNENPAPRGPRGQSVDTAQGRPFDAAQGRPFDAAQGRPRAAVYTREGAEKLAMNPLYDFVFLNLEGSYDAGAVKAMAAGLRSSKASGRKMLIVRIPPIETDGAAAARTRVKEILDAGADGVTIPHIRSLAEAREALAFFRDAGANVWSPKNRGGEKLTMLMLEDPAAVAQAKDIAALDGLSILACGIGSLTQALGGDRAGAEAGTQKVLQEAKAAGLPDMLTANTQDVAQRVQEGFLALLMQGPNADEAIKAGRVAAGR